jgi:hypothetical protein
LDDKHQSAMSLWSHLLGDSIIKVYREPLDKQYYQHRRSLYQYLLGLCSKYKNIYHSLIEDMQKCALEITKMLPKPITDDDYQRIIHSPELNKQFINKYTQLIQKSIQKLDKIKGKPLLNPSEMTVAMGVSPSDHYGLRGMGFPLYQSNRADHS